MSASLVTSTIAPIPKLGGISFNAAGVAPGGVALVVEHVAAEIGRLPETGTLAQAQAVGAQLSDSHLGGEGFLKRLFDGLGGRAGKGCDAIGESTASSSRYFKIGGSLVDRRAPGAPALMRALSFEPPRLVLGTFQPSRSAIFNGFAQGTEEVAMHVHALPGIYDADDIGGYTLTLGRNGVWNVSSSASVYSPITPAVARAVSRYFGLRPAGETRISRLRRQLLDWADVFNFL